MMDAKARQDCIKEIDLLKVRCAANVSVKLKSIAPDNNHPTVWAS